MGFAETQPYAQNIRPGWIGDFLDRTRVLAGGIKIDGSTFVAADAIAATVTTAALAGATSIPVTALKGPIPSGKTLDFGARAAVVVTLSGNTSADGTSISFAALTGAIPSGTTLDFGGQKFARTTAIAAAGATTVAVAAVPKALSTSDVATVPAVSARTATLSAAAATGATSITVVALPEGVAVGDVAYYQDPNTKKRIAAGTLVGITHSVLEAAGATGAKWHKAVDGDDLVRLLAYDVYDVDLNEDADILRPGTLIKVNNLPGFSSLSSTLKGKIRTTYETTVGTPGQEVPAS